MMSNWQATMGAISGLLSVICFVPYIITILQGKTKPHRATWTIWLILGIVLSASYYSTGAVNTLWLPVCAAFGQFIIVILSIKHGEGGWSRFDRFCLIGVGISLILWWQFNSAFIALLCNLFIDFLGALPTIKKSYYQPETEDLLTWILYLSASSFNLLALENWSFTLSVFPLYIFFVNVIIATLLLRRKVRNQISVYKQRQRRARAKKRRAKLNREIL